MSRAPFELFFRGGGAGKGCIVRSLEGCQVQVKINLLGLGTQDDWFLYKVLSCWQTEEEKAFEAGYFPVCPAAVRVRGCPVTIRHDAVARYLSGPLCASFGCGCTCGSACPK